MEFTAKVYETMAETTRIYTTWFRCVRDGRDHAVTDEEFAAPTAPFPGQYRAICDHLVQIAAAVTPPGQACPHCMDTLRGPAAVEPAPEAAPRLLARLFRRPRPPRPRTGH
ncbi:hypothetical protein FB471_0567 [Amycolatopsis cihanbeyliensis]|uniref:Uncharacterized protein n=2 Tax=Amycolatopsis cihanbeyliensis TaxID=1128664 RepID=A0A542DCY4_AMYCI|nr:hypothetical protein FB471_0567 [Amycolatopsis cihanbeyliensis]